MHGKNTLTGRNDEKALPPEILLDSSKKMDYYTDSISLGNLRDGHQEQENLNEIPYSNDEDNCSGMYNNLPLAEETTCTLPFLQRMANKNCYIALYGILGCFISACLTNFTGVLTTLEKRFQIPSSNSGILISGYDISQILSALFISYYAGKGHRPRWIAVGIFCYVLCSLLSALPHAIYGPGEIALQFTEEYGTGPDLNTTSQVIEQQKKKTLCQLSGTQCEEKQGSFFPQMILFMSQFLAGIGGGLFNCLGVTYIDDNMKKTKTAALLSFSFFLRLLGPALGYALASYSLKLYISPNLHPTITLQDPRWQGAWWMGFLVWAVLLASLGSLIGLFPRTLPRAAVRRAMVLDKNRGEEDSIQDASFSDLLATSRRLMKNTTFMYNNFAAIFYCLGYEPYFVFLPKYIEIMYKQSASFANFITGSVGLVFSAIGVLTAGVVITKFKPPARILAAWNVFIEIVAVMGMITYVFLGCDAPHELSLSTTSLLNSTTECNSACNCDFISYSPVCSEQGETFISPCHAGCRNSVDRNGTKTYTECSCIKPLTFLPMENVEGWGTTVEGYCPIDCTRPFYIFISIVCLLKFIGATGRLSNFLVSVRCIDEKDKTAALGFTSTFLGIFAFIPSPIIFGYILDSTCILWGKSCSGTGNCWLYDGYQLRHLLNLTSVLFVFIGALFDVGVWYNVKDLKIFEEEVTLKVVGFEEDST